MRTLVEQAAAVEAREISPTELVTASLENLAIAQRVTNAFTHVRDDLALAEARALESSPARGPLYGVPIVVKELYDVDRLPTTGCCAAFAQRIATRDSAVVAKLRAAGGIVLAKSNQHEMACGATGLLSSFGATRNPWDPDRLAGGSSGGSAAAVAGGVVTLAMGSDTGGSVRIPGALCGATALKTTHGSISLRGAMPLVPSLDSAGPITMSARDCGLAYRVLAGFDADDLWSSTPSPTREVVGIRGTRVAVLRRFADFATAEVRDAIDEAARVLETLGAVVDETAGPDPDEAWDAVGPVFVTEFAACYPSLADDERAHEEVRALIAAGAATPGPIYVRAIEACRRVARGFERTLSSADFLLAPAVAFPAPLADEVEIRVGADRTLDVRSGGLARLTIPVNVARLPALTFPVGRSSIGLPLAVQVIGPRWSDAALCALGASFQDATDWHRRMPRLDG